MKKLLLGLLVAVFFVPAFQGVPQAHAQDITLNEFTQICQTEFFSCYVDTPEGRAVAQQAIDVAQMVPPEDVSTVCFAFCDSSSIPERNTSDCTDEQCENRCTVLSGILDNQIMSLIEMMDYEALNELCPINCTVTIEKTTTLDNGTEFNFTAPDSSNPNFTLLNGEEIELEIDFPTNVDVTELVPVRWMLDEIECSDVDNVVITEIPNGRNFACNPAGTAQCVFINSPLPRNVPTLSQWGLIAMAGVLGIIGFLVMRRRKATA